jgi:hypothetical protein
MSDNKGKRRSQATSDSESEGYPAKFEATDQSSKRTKLGTGLEGENATVAGLGPLGPIPDTDPRLVPGDVSAGTDVPGKAPDIDDSKPAAIPKPLKNPFSFPKRTYKILQRRLTFGV